MRLVGPFTYTVSWAALAAAAQASTESIYIPTDADFMWLSTSYQADIAGAALTHSSAVVPLVTLQLSLTSNPFTDSETPLAGLAGGPVEGPRPLSEPFWLFGGATLDLSARNYSAGTDYHLFVALHGYKYKPAG